MNHKFKVTPHTTKPGSQVEVWINDLFVASIYADDFTGIKVISKYEIGIALSKGLPNQLNIGFELPDPGPQKRYRFKYFSNGKERTIDVPGSSPKWAAMNLGLHSETFLVGLHSKDFRLDTDPEEITE